MSTGCVVSLRRDWAIFCHAVPGRVGRTWSAREKSLKILRHGRELNPDHREDRYEIHLFSHCAIITDSGWKHFVLLNPWPCQTSKVEGFFFPVSCSRLGSCLVSYYLCYNLSIKSDVSHAFSSSVLYQQLFHYFALNILWITWIQCLLKCTENWKTSLVTQQGMGKLRVVRERSGAGLIYTIVGTS